MLWLPGDKLEVANVAVVAPPEMLRAPWPMLVDPSRKTTTPLG